MLGSSKEEERESSQMLHEAEMRKVEIQKAVLDWAQANLRDFPWRRDRTPYRVLVSEILLRRTTSSAVLRIYEAFLEEYRDVYSLANAELESLESMLRTIGYHRLRARILKKVASFIIEECGGVIPDSRSELLRIPHVGPYAAGSILSLGYGRRSAMVDSNVQRILGRVFKGCLRFKPRLKPIHETAEFLVPEQSHELFNLGLIDLGALVCRYDRPKCSACPLINVCDYPRQT